MATLSYKTLLNEVSEIVGEKVLKDILHYSGKNLDPKSLYGDNKESPKFGKYFTLMAIYKDASAIGSTKLRNMIPKKYSVSQESFLYNIQAAREVNFSWSESQITMPTIKVLNKKAKTIDLKGVPKKDKTGKTKVHLMMDSSDFKMKGKRSTSTKDPFWRYKENGPARRFMMVTDGRGSVKRIWGPYSPKTYDGDFLKCHQQDLSTALNKCNVVADCHFAWARPEGTINNVRFLVPYPKSNKKRKRQENNEDQDLDPLQKNYNKIVRSVRARVESPFGLMKQRFKALNGPFWEDEVQMKKLVYFAAVIENNRVRQ